MLLEKVFFVLFLTKLIFTQDNQGNEKKLNVVIFLAQPPNKPIVNDAGIKYLDFQKKARVKHCADGSEDMDSNVENDIAAAGSDCKQLLKAGIYSLISYCRNVMGMTTAIASVENDTFSNGLRFKKSAGEDLQIIYVNPEKKNVVDFGGDFPIINAFPPKRRLRFNNINQWSRHNKLITQPEHTETFKIRSKRELKGPPVVKLERGAKRKKRLEDAKSNWDIFGVVSNIKLTFFGKLLDDNEEKSPCSTPCSEHHSEPHFKVTPPCPKKCHGGVQSVGDILENPLFDLTKKTLSNIQEVCSSGFLMIIIGGYLKDICDPYSSMVQSIKHVTENTDDDNTLIVLTASCPDYEGCSKNSANNLLPVYVRGPPTCTGISSVTALYDVPYAIKSILADTNVAGSFISKVSNLRKKRAIWSKSTGPVTTSQKMWEILPAFCVIGHLFTC